MMRGGVDVGGPDSRQLVTFGLQNVTANVTNVIFFVTRDDFRSGFRDDFRSGFWGQCGLWLYNTVHGVLAGSDI